MTHSLPETLDLSLTVSKEYIDRGEPQDSKSCPIALSLRHKLREMFPLDILCAVYVDHCTVYAFDRGNISSPTRYIGTLPPIATNFVLDFDNQEYVFPISFDLSLTQVSQEEGV